MTLKGVNVSVIFMPLPNLSVIYFYPWDVFIKMHPRKFYLAMFILGRNGKVMISMNSDIGLQSRSTVADWWLVENHPSICVHLFGPKFYEDGVNLWMIFCKSISGDWVVTTVIGDGDTQTLTSVIKLIWTFCTWRGCWNIALMALCSFASSCSHTPRSHVVKLSLPIFV